MQKEIDESNELIEHKQTKITDWYNKLLDDLWELAQTKVIEFKHQIGKRVIQDWEKFGKPEYGNKFVETLAKDLEVSGTDLYKCIQFARSYPKLLDVYNIHTGVKKITWKWIRNELLPEHKEEKETPPLIVGENCNVIYSDPPWKYDFSETTSREIEQHYPTMELKELKKYKTKFNDNSLIFMWATAPKLREALELLEAWDFDYKTHAIWDKEKIGMGYWFRGQHELLMVGVKGEFSPPKEKERVSSVFRIPRTKHSKKPDEIMKLITEWYPKHEKMEMFRRGKLTEYMIKNNWKAWGNEVK